MANSQFWLVSPRGGARGTVQVWDRQVLEKSFRWGVLGGKQQSWGSCHPTSHCLSGLLPSHTPRSRGRSPCLAQAYSREPPKYLLDEWYTQSRAEYKPNEVNSLPIPVHMTKVTLIYQGSPISMYKITLHLCLPPLFHFSLQKNDLQANGKWKQVCHVHQRMRSLR